MHFGYWNWALCTTCHWSLSKFLNTRLYTKGSWRTSPRNFTWKEKTKYRLKKLWNSFYKREQPWTLACSSPLSPILFLNLFPSTLYGAQFISSFHARKVQNYGIIRNLSFVPDSRADLNLGWEEEHGIGQWLCSHLEKVLNQRRGDLGSIRVKRSVSRANGMKDNSFIKMRSLVWLEGTKRQSRKVKLRRKDGPRSWSPSAVLRNHTFTSGKWEWVGFSNQMWDTVRFIFLEGAFGNNFWNGLEKREPETQESHLGGCYAKWEMIMAANNGREETRLERCF